MSSATIPLGYNTLGNHIRELESVETAMRSALVLIERVFKVEYQDMQYVKTTLEKYGIYADYIGDKILVSSPHYNKDELPRKSTFDKITSLINALNKVKDKLKLKDTYLFSYSSVGKLYEKTPFIFSTVNKYRLIEYIQMADNENATDDFFNAISPYGTGPDSNYSIKYLLSYTYDCLLKDIEVFKKLSTTGRPERLRM